MRESQEKRRKEKVKKESDHVQKLQLEQFGSLHRLDNAVFDIENGAMALFFGFFFVKNHTIFLLDVLMAKSAPTNSDETAHATQTASFAKLADNFRPRCESLHWWAITVTLDKRSSSIPPPPN
jgi:hypothetical protein